MPPRKRLPQTDAQKEAAKLARKIRAANVKAAEDRRAAV